MYFLPTKDVIQEVQKIEGPLWKVRRCYSVCSFSSFVRQCFASDFLIFEGVVNIFCFGQWGYLHKEILVMT